jgi:cytochrome P450
VRVIAAILGVPDGDEDVFGRWTGRIMAGLSPLADAALRAAADQAAGALSDYLADLAERRRRAPGDRLLDGLIAAEAGGARLSPAELQDMVMSLLIGGHDTVRAALSSITWLVLAHPGTLDWLRGDAGRAAATVEEALRFEPPLLGVPRVAVAPLAVGGVEIAAGESVLLEITSANRDPRRFTDPDRFDPTRDASGHLAFGRGSHFCVGAALARAEARELLLVLAEGAPRLDLVEDPRWVPFSPARRLEALSVRAERSPSHRR